MRRPHIVIFSGAGFSAPLGYSTLYNFDRAIASDNRLSAPDQRNLIRLFHEVRTALASQHEPTDAEAILAKFASYLDICTKIRQDGFLNEALNTSVSDSFRYAAFSQRLTIGEQIVNKVILDHYIQKPKHKHATAIFQFLKAYAEGNDGGILDIFTTNYDVGLEEIWTDPEYETDKGNPRTPLVTAIKGKSPLLGKWHPIEVSASHRDPGVYLHHLHGCVGWFGLWENKTPHHADPTEVEAFGLAPPTRPWYPCIMYPGRKLRTTHHPFVHEFRNFAAALEKASHLVIIGTSFRDNNIAEYLLRRNDADTGRFAVSVVNTSDVRRAFRRRMEDARRNSHFIYPQDKWNIKFLSGSFLATDTQDQLHEFIRNSFSHGQVIVHEREIDA